MPADELEDIIGFCIDVGLPVTLKELGVEEVTKEQIMAVAEAACAETDTLHNMPFEVTPEKVYACLLYTSRCVYETGRGPPVRTRPYISSM